MFKDYNDMMATLERDKGPLPVYNSIGQIRAANQGKYEWRFEESPDKTAIIFEIRVPKFLPTHLIECDL